jgi:glucose-1-phosphate cytidylyltransferase
MMLRVKVMILCGGMGTRLREHTETRPKPMIEVGGAPILTHIMRNYAAHGMHEFVLCLGYLGHVIKEYFLNYEAMNSDFTVELGRRGVIRYHDRDPGEPGWSVTLADTGAETSTGARVKRAARYLDGGTFCITYGDGLADLDLSAVLAFHRAHGKLVTMTGVRPASRFGEIEHQGGTVTEFNEKPQVGQGLINGGFFFCEPGFLEYLSEDEGCILERQPLERCVAERQLRVYEHTGFWQCMDTYRDWEHLQQLWRSGRAPWAVKHERAAR